MNLADTYVTCVRVADAATVTPHGEFDIVTVDVLGEALRAAGDTAARVIVDLREVDFFGLAALDALLDAHRRLADQGGNLEMLSPSASVVTMVRALRASHLLASSRVVLPDVAGTDRPDVWAARRVTTTLRVSDVGPVAVS